MSKFKETCKWLFRITKVNFNYKKESIIDTQLPLNESTKIMSFNIRRDVFKDGENNWECRKEAIIDQIIGNNPDVICLQEVMPHMAKYIYHRLSRYYNQSSLEAFTWGDLTKSICIVGEGVMILYKKDKFKLKSLDKIKLFDGRVINMRRALCIKLDDIKSNKTLTIINTHLCHQSNEARSKSFKKLLDYYFNKCSSDTFICGDFNCELNDTGSGIDNFRSYFTNNIPDEKGTINFFSGASGKTIDFIFSNLMFTISEIDRTYYSGRKFTSDHWPVINTY